MTNQQNNPQQWFARLSEETILNETMNSVSNTSTQSFSSPKNISTLVGTTESGTSLPVSAEQSKLAVQLIAEATTVQQLNAQVPTSRQTRAVRREHRALLDLIESIRNGSIQKGCKHSAVIHRPDHLLAALKKAGILDQFIEYEKMYIGKFGRTGAALNLSFLYEYMEQIMEAIEDHTSYDPHEGFRVLCICWILAASEGRVLAESPLIDQLAHELIALPGQVVHKILTAS